MSLRAACLLLLATALTGRAQVSSIATNDDGSVILFSSSARFTGTNEGPQSKIFRWDGRFSLVFAPRASPADLIPAAAYDPVLSGDGAVFGYATNGACNIPCRFSTSGVTYVRDAATVQGGGTPGLSRNGRFAVIGPGLSGPLIHDRLDLVTGERVRLTETELVAGITNAGRVLLRGVTGGLRLVAPGEPDINVATLPDIRTAAMSANGARIVFTVRRGDFVELRMGEEILAVCQGADEVCRGYYPALSNDGRRALVREFTGLTDGWAWWIDLETRVRRELGPLRGIAATLSGDGRFAWLFEANGQLARVALDTGERTTAGEPFPFFTGSANGAEVRGSRVRMYGGGFGNDASALRITLSNPGNVLELPALAASEGFFDFQIPWSLPQTLSTAWMAVGRRGEAFELASSLRLGEFATPSFWTEPDAPRRAGLGLIIAAHGDYRGRVTPEDPARPGEVVHVYMAGLGAVSPPQQDFTPAPSDPPARLVTPPACAYGGAPTRTEFAGLAPGMIGVYLVSIEIPRDWAGPPELFCPVDDGAGRRSTTGYLPASK